ncbi:MAG: glycosyltransferase family 4 protein [bacterium]
MKIGIIVSRIGGEDGVALETEKWAGVLREMGHEVFIASGRFEKDILVSKKYTKRIKNLSFGYNINEKQRSKVFDVLGSISNNPKIILRKINQEVGAISRKLIRWINDNNLKLLILENTNSLPVHLPLAKAIKDVIEKTGINAISHNHDFHWERGKDYVSPYEEINSLVKELFPLQLPQVKHVVINSAARKKLKKDFGIKAVYIPNVMDFRKPFGKKTEKNKNLLKELGLNEDDIPIFQVTRIIRRKNIETSIKLVKKLDDEKVKLIITGSADDDPGKGYYKEIRELTKLLGIEKQILFAGDKFFKGGFLFKYLYFKNLLKNKYREYNHSDAYSAATACAFFSRYEGFGNAFIEAVAAKKPIFVNNYEPVFWPDIGRKGFKVVMLEKGNLTQEAVNKIREIIYDKSLAREIANYNFDLGKKYFSSKILKTKLKRIFNELEI